MTARVGEIVSCRERKGHKREGKDCKDGEKGKGDSAMTKQSVREMLKSSEWEDYIEMHRIKASEKRCRGSHCSGQASPFHACPNDNVSLQVEGIEMSLAQYVKATWHHYLL